MIWSQWSFFAYHTYVAWSDMKKTKISFCPRYLAKFVFFLSLECVRMTQQINGIENTKTMNKRKHSN